MAVTWLHISDMHVRDDASYDRDVVFRALVRSVRRFRERDNRCPDVVFATGDIAFSGKAAEYQIATDFFDRLLEAAVLDRSRLYVVPGNHDVDRDIGRQLLRELPSRSAADDYFDPSTPKLHLTFKQAAFLQWHDHYFQGIRQMPQNSTCGPVELVRIREQRIGILPINTSLFCQDDHDHERLSIGRRCLENALQQLNELGADLQVALMHHPIHDLSAIERQHVRAGLVDHVDVILNGHSHEAGFATVGMWTPRNLYCTAGATYQTRDWPNTAYYGTFHYPRRRLSIFPIRYEDQPREVWTVDPSLFTETASYEMSFPVPLEPNFRSFSMPGDRARGPRETSLSELAAEKTIRKRTNKKSRKGRNAKSGKK